MLMIGNIPMHKPFGIENFGLWISGYYIVRQKFLQAKRASFPHRQWALKKKKQNKLWRRQPQLQPLQQQQQQQQQQLTTGNCQRLPALVSSYRYSSTQNTEHKGCPRQNYKRNGTMNAVSTIRTVVKVAN